MAERTVSPRVDLAGPKIGGGSRFAKAPGALTARASSRPSEPLESCGCTCALREGEHWDLQAAGPASYAVIRGVSYSAP